MTKSAGKTSKLMMIALSVGLVACGGLEQPDPETSGKGDGHGSESSLADFCISPEGTQGSMGTNYCQSAEGGCIGPKVCALGSLCECMPGDLGRIVEYRVPAGYFGSYPDGYRSDNAWYQ